MLWEEVGSGMWEDVGSGMREEAVIEKKIISQLRIG